MRRLLILVVAVVLGAAALPAVDAMPAGAQAVDPAAAEADFVARINALRQSKGLGTLTVAPELVDVARAWSTKMAAADQISHNPDLAKQVQADWQKLGENVGVGATAAKLHEAFVNSPAHYRNIADPDFTHIGVGVVLGRDGAIFTTHLFMKLRPAAASAAASRAAPTTSTTAEAAPAAQKLAAPLAPVAAPQPTGRLVLVLEQLRDLDRQ